MAWAALIFSLVKRGWLVTLRPTVATACFVENRTAAPPTRLNKVFRDVDSFPFLTPSELTDTARSIHGWKWKLIRASKNAFHVGLVQKRRAAVLIAKRRISGLKIVPRRWDSWRWKIAVESSSSGKYLCAPPSFGFMTNREIFKSVLTSWWVRAAHCSHVLLSSSCHCRRKKSGQASVYLSPRLLWCKCDKMQLRNPWENETRNQVLRDEMCCEPFWCGAKASSPRLTLIAKFNCSTARKRRVRIEKPQQITRSYRVFINFPSRFAFFW